MSLAELRHRGPYRWWATPVFPMGIMAILITGCAGTFASKHPGHP